MAENPPTAAPPVRSDPTTPGAGAEGSHDANDAKVTRSRVKVDPKTLIAKYGLLIAFVAVIAVFAILKPHVFPTGENIKSMLTQAAPPAILAVGLTVVLVMQDFDLSFGSMIGLSGGAVTTFLVMHHWGWVVAVIVVLIMGIAVGLLNGFMIAYLGGSSFIITLAMGTVLTGVEYALTKQNTVYSGYSTSFTGLASNSSILGISNQVWIAGVIAALVWVLMDRTEVGRYMYAIGGNPEAARLSGLRVRPLRVAGFVVVGLCAAAAGILLISEASSYSPNVGATYLLPAFAAAFLGAAVFRPGEFNLPGTIIGVLFLTVIQTGLIELNLQTYIINLVQGGILIFAVLVSRLGAQATA
jgi:ribose transport system permease protein